MPCVHGSWLHHQSSSRQALLLKCVVNRVSLSCGLSSLLWETALGTQQALHMTLQHQIEPRPQKTPAAGVAVGVPDASARGVAAAGGCERSVATRLRAGSAESPVCLCICLPHRCKPWCRQRPRCSIAAAFSLWPSSTHLLQC